MTSTPSVRLRPLILSYLLAPPFSVRLLSPPASVCPPFLYLAVSVRGRLFALPHTDEGGPSLTRSGSRRVQTWPFRLRPGGIILDINHSAGRHRQRDQSVPGVGRPVETTSAACRLSSCPPAVLTSCRPVILSSCRPAALLLLPIVSCLVALRTALPPGHSSYDVLVGNQLYIFSPLGIQLMTACALEMDRCRAELLMAIGWRNSFERRWSHRR